MLDFLDDFIVKVQEKEKELKLGEDLESRRYNEDIEIRRDAWYITGTLSMISKIKALTLDAGLWDFKADLKEKLDKMNFEILMTCRSSDRDYSSYALAGLQLLEKFLKKFLEDKI
jgi:hypothetical protein